MNTPAPATADANKTQQALLAALSLVAVLAAIIYFATRPEFPSYSAADLDMTGVTDLHEKKQRFFDFMRPIVDEENRRILADRTRLLKARKSGRDRRWVAELALRYKVNWDGSDKSWRSLVERVDAVPRELALAQSANESSWGQSRFAREGNNFFGQWCFRAGCGIVPGKRDTGARHELAVFNDVNASVRSYLRILNTGRVYARLRNLRAQARNAGREPDAMEMATGLSRYSERGEAYIREIRAMIRSNRDLL